MALTKILNDENKSFQPVLTDKLVYDTKPTVNSFNGITSDAVARAIAGASGEVPAVTESDNGKILTAIYDAGGAAVEWADAPSGIPDMTNQDGKILGAVDNGGTMEAQWISKPVSNVTTSDKQFVVGINGTGKPITVDCANATAVGSTATFTENGSYTTMSNKPCVNFPLAHLDPCSLGSGTATLTIPEDITYDTSNMAISSVQVFYWQDLGGSTGTAGPNCNISESILSTGKIKAGTYTISGANAAASYGWDDGITIYIYGSGNSPAWDNFVTSFTEAIQSWTLSYSASEVTGYSITPAVLPTVTGNAGKVLGVNAGATGVEWVAQSTVTVDQSYNSASANAQSGTAVAQAIAAIPSSSYTAGDGIDITANEVSVKAGRNLGFEANSTTVNLQSPTCSTGGGSGYAFLGKLDADTVALLKSGTVSLTPKYNYTISMTGVVNSGARFAICQSSGYNVPWGNGKWLVSDDVLSESSATSFVLTADTAYTVDFSSLSSKSTGTWTDVEAAPTNFYLALIAYSSQYTLADLQVYGNTGALTNPSNPGDVSSYTIGDPNDIRLYAEDQLPSVTGNAGKVLTVNSGATGVEWTPTSVEVVNLPATTASSAEIKGFCSNVIGYVNAGKAIIGRVEVSGQVQYFFFQMYRNSSTLVFTQPVTGGTGIFCVLQYNPLGTSTVEYTEAQYTPTTTSTWNPWA